jgi:hypothetical protein
VGFGEIEIEFSITLSGNEVINVCKVLSVVFVDTGEIKSK